MPNLYLIAIVATLSFLGGWNVNGWRWEAKYLDREIELEAQADKALAERQQQIVKADKIFNELEDARDENAKLRSDVAAGRARLRINATCTGEGKTTSSGMDQAQTCRLTPDAEQAYFHLRDGIIFHGKQLEACQSLL